MQEQKKKQHRLQRWGRQHSVYVISGLLKAITTQTVIWDKSSGHLVLVSALEIWLKENFQAHWKIFTVITENSLDRSDHKELNMKPMLWFAPLLNMRHNNSEGGKWVSSEQIDVDDGGFRLYLGRVRVPSKLMGYYVPFLCKIFRHQWNKTLTQCQKALLRVMGFDKLWLQHEQSSQENWMKPQSVHLCKREVQPNLSVENKSY